MTREDEVRQASARLYGAFNRGLDGDTQPMQDAWWHDADVTALQPMGGREVGWDQVWQSFAQAGPAASGGQVRLEDQLIRVDGDFAYELGTERGQATIAGEEMRFAHRVTNIYRRKHGQWKLVHHHTDVEADMAEQLKRLQAEGMAAA